MYSRGEGYSLAIRNTKQPKNDLNGKHIAAALSMTTVITAFRALISVTDFDIAQEESI
jgi:hypothetical protein